NVSGRDLENLTFTIGESELTGVNCQSLLDQEPCSISFKDSSMRSLASNNIADFTIKSNGEVVYKDVVYYYDTIDNTKGRSVDVNKLDKLATIKLYTQFSDNTEITVTDETQNDSDGITLESAQNQNYITVKLKPTANTKLGEHKIRIDVKDKNGTVERFYTSIQVHNTNGMTINNNNNVLTSYTGSLTDVVIPYGVTEIANFTFDNYPVRPSGGLTSVVIPDGVRTIGIRAFASNDKLSTVVIPNGVTTIGLHAFSYSTQLTSAVLPEGITIISSNLFSNTKLTSVKIPDSVISIKYGAFWQSTFTSIKIPKNVTTIEDKAFELVPLSSVVIPKSVIKIGSEAFYQGHPTKLQSVIICRNKEPSSAYDFAHDAFKNFDNNKIIWDPNHQECQK
uniref:leucine-rich repeat domain-containing protein n=1 Tax=Fastidiosibacter lacustris TaxID=2056695 RepID=UPI001300B7D5